MATPNQLPGQSPEISTEQIDDFVKAVRRLLDRPVLSFVRIGPQEELNLDELKKEFPDLDDEALSEMRDALLGAVFEDEPEEDEEASGGIIEVHTDASYMLGSDRIFLDETSHVGTYYHQIRVDVKQPPVIIDEKYYSETTKDFCVDREAGWPLYRETQRIFERATGKMLRSLAVDSYEQGGDKGVLKETVDQFDLDKALGLNVFSQEKFDEVMAILAQLGPHNRIYNRVTGPVG